ncbi:MAG: hypothetical protein IKK79_05530 [Spirochaetaceae bacterium]|nr:hypothetical protein [Spirochaetaceae bacterium]
MNREEIDYVQSTIGYTFENVRLLNQAFTRKSYATENPGTLDNEVLEFYGDRVLDLYVTRMMYREFSSLTKSGMESKMSEGNSRRFVPPSSTGKPSPGVYRALDSSNICT